MQSKIETVTPSIAKNWLTRNTGNRAVRPSHVNSLAAAIKAGDFQLTHQGIAFDEDGVLLDGQHRLHAVIEADKPAQFLIIRGAQRETFAYLDIGAKRNTADQLKIDRKTAEVVLQLGRMLFTSMRPTPAQLQMINLEIGGTSDQLSEFCNGSSKIFSSSSMRLAAITSVEMGEDKDYVFGLYRNLVNHNLHDLPPIGHSAVSQVLRNDMRVTDKSDVLARGMKIFRQENSNSTRLQIKEASIELDTIRSFYRKKMRI